MDNKKEEIRQAYYYMRQTSPLVRTTSICFISLPQQLSSNSHFPLPLSDIELPSHHDPVTRCGLE